jgi:1,5-anhydro-D-fructose reductase (1,5-anhydro-D-mannitol-forming)
MALRWGIVGPGRIANDALAPAISKDPNSELVAVVSRDPDRARAFADRHGCRWAGTDYEGMLALPDVDVVLIATPNALHADQVVAAARAGKHVFCEKPLATTAPAARRAVDACREAGVTLGINFQTRWQQAFRDARHVIMSGEIGDVVAVQIDASPGRRPPGGWRTDPDLAGLASVFNIGVHIYDALRFILQSEVVEVAAMFDTGRKSRQIETLPMVLLRFDNGALAYANGNQATPFPLNDMVVYGTKGRIDGRGITRPGMEGEMTVVTESGSRTARYSSVDCYDRTVAAFSEAVLKGRDPDPSGLDGLRSAELADAIAKAASEGRVVELRVG